jgi:hypothetical protein
MTWAALRRPPTLAAVVGSFLAFAGLLMGLGALGDNSFFTHLATGRIILATHHVPGHDPYSWTVPGHAWVVQSWLASAIYAWADRLGGAGALHAVIGLSAAVLGALVWTLTRPAQTVLSRLLAAMIVIGVGLDYWRERPLLFGLIGLALALLAAEGRLDPRWLVPVMWAWANVHGSWPLGLVALAALAVGRYADERSAPAELAALQWAIVGSLAAVIGPLGFKVVLFPLHLLAQQHVLHNVIEWQAPRFESIGERMFLVELVVSVIVLTRRPSWRVALPLAIFTVAALLGTRNVVVASIVLLPGMARGMAGLGSVRGDERRPPFRLAAAAVAVVFVLAIAVKWDSGFDLDTYPVAAVAWMQTKGLTRPGTHIVAEDVVGNYLEGRFGPRRTVFLDDRYDMYPTEVVDDYLTLLRGERNWQSVLRRYHPDAVLWERTAPLAELLEESPDWKVVYDDSQWLVFQPRAAAGT